MRDWHWFSSRSLKYWAIDLRNTDYVKEIAYILNILEKLEKSIYKIWPGGPRLTSTTVHSFAVYSILYIDRLTFARSHY